MNRREWLRALVGTAALATSGWVPPALARSRRPNVVVLLTDDQGAGDMGCYGADYLHTPHMDTLAARGVRFTQFYVTAPMCSASRISLLTGRYFQRSFRGAAIDPAAVTLGEVFRDAGYRTALFGKWHLGGPPFDPNAQGFERFLGHRVGAIDNYSHYAYWSSFPLPALYRDRQPYREAGSFFPDIIVRESRDFIARHRDEPFLLFVSFNQPHYPLQPEARFLAQYPEGDLVRRLYGATMTSLDDKIGQILGALDEHGLRDDTIVLLLSDNGHSEEPLSRGGGSAGSFRGAKKTLWEGGIRMPCVLSWPGHVPQGETRPQMASALDWLPTLAGYAGIPMDHLHPDGADLAGVIAAADAPTPHQVLHWMVGSHWAVHAGRWKMLHTPQGTFLTDLDTDPAEADNLARQHPEITARLQGLHQDWLSTGIRPVYTVQSDDEGGGP